MKYQVKITEYLSKIIEVEADDEVDARLMAEELYCEEIVVLDYTDFDNVEFEIYED
jgi:uncharacterized protein YqfA (UPF0365 family)